MQYLLVQFFVVSGLLLWVRFGKYNEIDVGRKTIAIPYRVCAGIAGCLILFSFQAMLSQILDGMAISYGIKSLMAFSISGLFAVSIPVLVMVSRVDSRAIQAGVFSKSSPTHSNVGTVVVVAGSCFLFAKLYLAEIQLGNLATVGSKSNDFSKTFSFLLLAGLVAPVVEEILFRGLIFRGLYNAKRSLTAAVLSALIFALFHSAEVALPVFVLGLGCAVVYEQCQTLVAPIAVHAAYNLGQLLF